MHPLCSHPLDPDTAISFQVWLYFEMPGQVGDPKPNWQRLLDFSDGQYESAIATDLESQLPQAEYSRGCRLEICF